jgi:hypothetical protein
MTYAARLDAALDLIRHGVPEGYSVLLDLIDDALAILVKSGHKAAIRDNHRTQDSHRSDDYTSARLDMRDRHIVFVGGWFSIGHARLP